MESKLDDSSSLVVDETAIDASRKKQAMRSDDPHAHANIISRLFMFWASGLVSKGYREVLMPEDLWPIRPELSAESCYGEFDRHWKDDQDEATVLRALRSNMRPFGFALLLQFGYTCCNFGITLMLLWLIGSLQDITTGQWLAWMYGGILVGLTFIAAFFRCHALLYMVETVVAIRNALMTAVYRKSTRLSSKALASMDFAKITNLMSSDSTQIVQLGRWLALGFIAPFDVIGVFIFLGFVVGPVACVVIGVFVISLPLNGIAAQGYFNSRKRAAPLIDKRLRASGEFVKYVRAIKYYAWELFFTDRINKCRDEELTAVNDVNNTRSYLLQISSAVGSVSLLLVLMSFVEAGNRLTPANVFTVFRLVQMLRMPFIMIPITLSAVLSLKVSFARLTNFMKLPELNPLAVDRTVVDGNVGVVSVANGSFSWGSNVVLKDININFPKGKLTMVIGQVGAGKSSLLSAILGDMEQGQDCRVAVAGSVAYAAQSAFIVNDTLKNNVLFGRPFDEGRYRRALRASDLESDLKLLPGGDLTEIGERGINLSGGQKQRVSLARALYAEADVVLLDDCLSAVDAHVAEHIFRKAIQGVLANRTVILVSNQLQFLPSADYVVALEGGTVREQGTYATLMESGGDFRMLVESFGVHAEDEEKKKVEAREMLQREMTLYQQKLEEQRSNAPAAEAANRKKSLVADENRILAGRLVQAEQMSNSSYVDFKVYWSYIKSGGLFRFISMSFFLLLCCVATFIPGLWIGYWSVFYLGHDDAFYIGILAVITFGELCTYFLGSYIGMSHSRHASKELHSKYLDRLAHAQISFYDRTPIGRIMNRLSKDMDDVDGMLGFQLQQYVRNVGQMLAIIALIGYASPWLLLIVLPLAGVFWIYLRIYRRTAVRVQRIESITLSPIFQHFAETLPGLSTIRAYNNSDNEIRKSNQYINADSLAEFALRAVDTWLAIRLDMICFISTCGVVFLMIGLRNTLNPIVAGFSINYILASVNILSFFSQNITQLENIMNSVERIDMFSAEIPVEAPFDIPETKPVPEWPQTGKIEFEHVQFSYREGLPPVLKDICFTVNGSEKVGIVGRTGAGKSSILVILLRMAELTGGTIRIDGVDISKIGLHDLRSRIAIIPQEPTLFSGTVRTNLDPFGEHKDEDLWAVLEQAQLKAAIERDGGLEAPVNEDGTNYSLGQRQLLCMARALLRKPKILLMDEATASVDMENDVLIQETVRSEFKSSTVLTIAHRLHTVADSDVVMVLNKGTLTEMDRPEHLVRREESMFKGLIEATGPSSSAYLTHFILHGRQEGSTVGSLIKLDAAAADAKARRKNLLNAQSKAFGDIAAAFDQSAYVIPGKKKKKNDDENMF